MFEQFSEDDATTIREAENTAASGDLLGALQALRKTSLDTFGLVLISLPIPSLPNLSRLLPRMASDEVQRNWTGNSGAPLLAQTNYFAKLLMDATRRTSGKILDFGCGYGRIMRALYYYADPDNLYGCDPWGTSIQICKADGMLGHFAISDYLPRSLPFNTQFELIYAFSVFTHLSERATTSCMSALADACAPNGTIAITIRPIEYWSFAPDARDKEFHRREHASKGFTFFPHLRDKIDGDVTYGDTSMSIDWIKTRFPQLKIVSTLPTHDPLQNLVILTPAN